MLDSAIRVKGLSKQYRIGVKVEPYFTLRDALSQFGGKIAGAFSRNGRKDSKGTLFWALKDVSFEVKQGEVIGIVGRNGAGKTTLLKILSRITEPTEGRAEMHGRVASLLEVGTGFHPELTGWENIFLSGAILGMKKAEISRKFDEIVAFAEVERFVGTPVKRYSSGMYLRLAFAVAAHLNPEILLVDEVLAVGDANFQKKCLGKMGEVAQQGRTVLFVSHNMGAVLRLCNRAIHFDNGKIVQSGPVRQVITDYLGSGMGQLGERVWTDLATAPGNDVVRLQAVRACNAQGQVANEFKVTEPFCVEVEFLVLMPQYKLDVGLDFLDGSGNVIFVASDFQDDTWHYHTRPVGIHRSRCHVPQNLLNEGTISINAAVVTNPHTEHAKGRDAIFLRLIDDFEPGGARGNYTRAWPGGAVRPLMKWTFDFEALNERSKQLHDTRIVDIR